MRLRDKLQTFYSITRHFGVGLLSHGAQFTLQVREEGVGFSKGSAGWRV